MVISLQQTKPVLVDIRPLHIDRGSRSRDRSITQTLDSLFSISQRAESNQSCTRELSVFVDSLDLQDGAVVVEVVPDILLVPALG